MAPGARLPHHHPPLIGFIVSLRHVAGCNIGRQAMAESSEPMSQTHATRPPASASVIRLQRSGSWNLTATNAPSVASHRRQRRDSGSMRQGLLDGGPEQREAEIDFGLGHGQRRGDPHHPGGGAGAHDIGAEPER
jgi:hypothetical protein